MELELTVLRALLAQSPERSRWLRSGCALPSPWLLAAPSGSEGSASAREGLTLAAESSSSESAPPVQHPASRIHACWAMCHPQCQGYSTCLVFLAFCGSGIDPAPGQTEIYALVGMGPAVARQRVFCVLHNRLTRPWHGIFVARTAAAAGPCCSHPQ